MTDRDRRRGDRPRVGIDLVPIHAGHGGTGGGIWSYARHLVQELDRLAPDDIEIVVLAHPGQSLALRHLRVERVAVDTRATAHRLAWIHAGLPARCRRLGIRVLHKLATEVPLAMPRTRLVTTVHDFMPQFFRESLPEYTGRSLGHPLHAAYFELATRRCFARSDAVIVLTETGAAEARRRFPRATKRLVVVPNGVNHPDVTPTRTTPSATPTADAPLRLLYVGTHSPYKGQLNAVRGLARLAERDAALAARLTLTFRGFVAEPRYHDMVRDAAARSGVADRIRFAPYEPDAGASDIYASGDALVLLSDYEGFGLPPLEAQAAGLPVLCADLPVFREVLGDGAHFVSQRDPDAVAEGLRRIATEPALRAELVRRGRKNAARFSWARTARETLAVYRSLATATAARAG